MTGVCVYEAWRHTMSNFRNFVLTFPLFLWGFGVWIWIMKKWRILSSWHLDRHPMAVSWFHPGHLFTFCEAISHLFFYFFFVRKISWKICQENFMKNLCLHFLCLLYSCAKIMSALFVSIFYFFFLSGKFHEKFVRKISCRKHASAWPCSVMLGSAWPC